MLRKVYFFLIFFKQFICRFDLLGRIRRGNHRRQSRKSAHPLLSCRRSCLCSRLLSALCCPNQEGRFPSVHPVQRSPACKGHTALLVTWWLEPLLSPVLLELGCLQHM